MKATEILIQQTEQVYALISKLTKSIPYEKWQETPQTLETNVSWQVGHLMVSYHYHTIMCMHGIQKELFVEFPKLHYMVCFR